MEVGWVNLSFGLHRESLVGNEKLKDAVNKSGFPLQIGLEHLVNETCASHGWKVIYSEHSWKNLTDGNSGFIDLVLENQYRTSVLIVETKRTLETSWIFLIDDPKQLSRRHAKSWLMRYLKNGGGLTTYFGLKELTLEPTTPESQYCVVGSGDSKNQPILERIASDVVSSTEGFANEEKELRRKDNSTFRMYFSVIVTTAKLQVCSFNPADVSIKDGTIKNAKFEEVPYLRFRKQLTSHHDVPESNEVGDYRAFALEKESTVFVVNAESLPIFLSEFDVDANANANCLNL